MIILQVTLCHLTHLVLTERLYAFPTLEYRSVRLGPEAPQPPIIQRPAGGAHDYPLLDDMEALVEVPSRNTIPSLHLSSIIDYAVRYTIVIRILSQLAEAKHTL